MDCIELLDILDNGEDSTHQFKLNFNSIDKLAVEISAFANSQGGIIVVGVSNTGVIIGLSRKDIDRLNQWISNSTSQKIDPPIYVTTEILKCDQERILIIDVPRGTSKPYAVNKSEFWVKNGADKRRANREELYRLMQASNIISADEMPTEATMENLDMKFFKQFYENYYDEKLETIRIPLIRFLENIKLMTDRRLTLAGLLLFSKNPNNIKSQFFIKATYFDGNTIGVNSYIDMENIKGKLIEQYENSIAFLKRNLRKIQRGTNFNTKSTIEIPEEAFIEAIANAIIHRDYFIDSQIFINLFRDRLEIISPGTLPNTLNEENIKYGVHIERNPTIITFLSNHETFFYTGRGSGIRRIIEACEKIDIKYKFVNDIDTQRFKVIFYRP